MVYTFIAANRLVLTCLDPCPAGSYKDGSMTECQQCPINMYSAEKAGLCATCPRGSLASDDHTKCSKYFDLIQEFFSTPYRLN